MEPPARERYERYKEALRSGHLALLRGRPHDARTAFESAAHLAPERAAPLAGLAATLRALGLDDDALAAYGRALTRAPRDEAALAGRADLLVALGRRAAAADDLSALAEALEASGRLADAADAAQRALELAESRARRRLAERLAERLRGSQADEAAVAALESALLVLEPGAMLGLDRQPGEASLAGSRPEQLESALEAVAADFDALEAEVAAATDAADEARARVGLLTLARLHRDAGRPNAALDACLRALAMSPDDPGLHVLVAELQLDRGWRAVATEKLRLLTRLGDLTDDPSVAARVAEVSARLADAG
jgi:tetratricopeptide (TPR) repeat protein